MPDVNLLKDTERLANGQARPVAPGQPELSTPQAPASSGFGSSFKSLFNRGPKPLPTSMGGTAPAARPQTSSMSASRSRSGERILSETKKAAPSVIPLPEDDDTSYNVNLLSEDLISTVNPKKRGIMLGVVAIIAAAVVGLGYGGILAYQNSIKAKITTTQSALTTANAEISGLSKDQLLAAATVQKVNAIHSLVDRHTRWTKFFSLLEKYTLPTITYGSSFSGDLNGTLTLTGTTTSYEEVAKQYLIFQQLVRDQKFISNFLITGATSQVSKEGTPTTTFVVTMNLLPNNFTMTAAELTAIAPILAPIVTQPTTLESTTNTNSTTIISNRP